MHRICVLRWRRGLAALAQQVAYRALLARVDVARRQGAARCSPLAPRTTRLRGLELTRSIAGDTLPRAAQARPGGGFAVSPSGREREAEA
jgi:hypothetical protein